jgi:membrane fusion protein (multidrug efflux system)
LIGGKKILPGRASLTGKVSCRLDVAGYVERVVVDRGSGVKQGELRMVHARQELQRYLHIDAPFDGMITARLVHPGALVGPGSDLPLLVLQQLSKLRLVVAVPEEDSGSVPMGAKVAFHVPAFAEKTFYGVVARSSHELDPKTRTMAIEMDVVNFDGALAPGMYPTVSWPVHQAHAALLVPATSVVTTTERTFVIRNQGGHAEWVDVKKGAAAGDPVEVTGRLKAGDMIVRRASDETHDGSVLQAGK